MSKRFALLVGMTAYQDDRLVVTATNKEIRILVEHLRDPENGRFDRVVPLLNQTAVELQLGIASFFEQEMQPGDLVLFYFAGHSLIHHQNLYLATTDTFTEEYLDATTVEVDFLRRRLNACPAQQLILLDSEFSLIGATDRHADGYEMLVQGFQAKNRAVLAGTPLTNVVIEGLDGAADANRDGTVTFAEIGSYAEAQLPETAPSTMASHEALDQLPLGWCQPAQTAVLVPPPLVVGTSVEPESVHSVSNRRRYGVLAVLLLLLLTVFGLYGLSSGWFSGGTTADTQSAAASPTTAVMAAFEAGETPSATSTIEVPEAAATATPPPSLTAVIQETSTAAATDTPVVTETLAATESPTPTATEVVPTSSATSESTETVTATATSAPTATHSPTPAATSEPVPMTVIAQQAFLRDGPGINYRILDFPGQGTAVTVIARNGDANWYNVLLADGSRGWLHKDVLEPEDEGAFDGITVAATIPVPLDDFYDPILTPSGDSISVQVYHTYVGTQGENAQFQARLLPETDLVQPTYLSGRDLGIGLLIVAFNRVAEGEYTSSQVELCMVSETGNPFYCETVPVRKSW